MGFALAVFGLFCAGVPGGVAARAETPAPAVGVEEKLGSFIPLDTVFNDEAGKPVPLRTLLTKPTLLLLVYYECPNICNPLMNSLVDTLNRTDIEPGHEFQVLTISFDETETYTLAAKKKENYLKSFHRPFPPDAWRFLTGDKQSIDAITDAVGFRFQRMGRDFNHAGVITVLAADGKIARYLHGITFMPFDVKMSLIEAAKGKTMPPLNRVLAFCYSYDPEGRRYAFNFLKVVGVSVSTTVGMFVVWLIVTTRRYRKGMA